MVIIKEKIDVILFIMGVIINGIIYVNEEINLRLEGGRNVKFGDLLEWRLFSFFGWLFEKVKKYE